MKTQKRPKPQPVTRHRSSRHISSVKFLSHTKRRRASYPLHKRILLHPLSTFAILLCGVLIVGWTYRVIAATIISSVIEAPPLTTSAHISSPVNKSAFTAQAISVLGSCPTASYVKLSINGAFSGVGLCDSTGSFAIKTSLYPGHNTITPQAYNITDLPGPQSDSYDVVYNPPAVPSTNSARQSTVASTGRSQPSTVTPLVLSSNFQFRTFKAVKNFSWTVDLEGGLPPYHVSVDWGDKTSTTYNFAADPVFTITHVYQTPGYYPVTLASVDTTGSQQVLQLAALITDASGQAPFLTTPTPPNTIANSTPTHAFTATAKWLLLAWPSYLVIALMTFSFWLGERRKFLMLKARH